MTTFLVGLGAAVRRLLFIGVVLFAAPAAVVALSSCATEESRSDGPVKTTMPTESTVATVTTVARKSVTHDFVVPAGTFESLDKGEDPGIIPRRLDVRVGDRIRVRNDDTELVRLGLFDVAPGETVSMTFNKVGPVTGVIFDDAAGGCGSPPPEDKKFIVNVKP